MSRRPFPPGSWGPRPPDNRPVRHHAATPPKAGRTLSPAEVVRKYGSGDGRTPLTKGDAVRKYGGRNPMAEQPPAPKPRKPLNPPAAASIADKPPPPCKRSKRPRKPTLQRQILRAFLTRKYSNGCGVSAAEAHRQVVRHWPQACKAWPEPAANVPLPSLSTVARELRELRELSLI